MEQTADGLILAIGSPLGGGLHVLALDAATGDPAGWPGVVAHDFFGSKFTSVEVTDRGDLFVGGGFESLGHPDGCSVRFSGIARFAAPGAPPPDPTRPGPDPDSDADADADPTPTPSPTPSASGPPPTSTSSQGTSAAAADVRSPGVRLRLRRGRGHAVRIGVGCDETCTLTLVARGGGKGSRTRRLRLAAGRVRTITVRARDARRVRVTAEAIAREPHGRAARGATDPVTPRARQNGRHER